MQENLLLELKDLVIKIINDPTNLELIEMLENYHNSDIADVLEILTEDERLLIYDILGNEKISEIVSYYENVEEFISEIEPEQAADIIELMDSDDAVNVLNELEEEDKQRIIELMDEEAKESVELIEGYDEDLVGSYISDNFIVIPKKSTVKSAMSKMVKMAGEHDNIYTLYVVDDDNKFIGAVQLKDLITARSTDSFQDLIMNLCGLSVENSSLYGYPSFYDTDIMSDSLEKIKDYSETSIPVLNADHEIIGVLTTDSLIEATTDEFEEDYAKFGGLTEEEDIDEPVLQSIKKRIPWLIVLLFLGLLVSSVIGIFESVIISVPIIVFFQSMILGMAGNVGTQSLAVTIRNISNESLASDRKKQIKSIFKELRIGFLNGLIIGFVSFVFVFLYLIITKSEVNIGSGFEIASCIMVSGIIAFSMLVSITLASVIGTCFPLLLTKLKIDPAVASGPFITTLNDVIAVIVYYGLTFLLFIVLM